MKRPVLNRALWTKAAQGWAKLKPPERPSKPEIKIYEKWVKKITEREKCPRAIIYGATPELRDLLAKYRFKVTLVDINPNMVRAMQELLKISRGKEKVVIANWLDVPLKSCRYDLICCDHGIHHLLFKNWSRFLKEAKRLLKLNGYLLNNMVAMPKRERATVREMVRTYKRNPKKFTRQDKFYYYSRIFVGLKDYRKQKHIKKLGVLNEELRDLLKKGIINRGDYKFLASPWEGYICSVAPQRVIDKLFKKHFKILSKKAPKGKGIHPVYSFHHIYCLEPK